jgi:thiol-disulfide isomerase/thioredoxin
VAAAWGWPLKEASLPDPAFQPSRCTRAGLAGAAALAAAAMLVAGCSAGTGTSSQAGGVNPGITIFKPGTGPPAPAVTGAHVGGGKLTLTPYRGHVTVLNFWGSWCTSCREEASSLAAAARRFQPSGVRFAGVDIEDNTASAQAYMATYRISYPSFSDPGDAIALDFRNTVPADAIPSTIIISGTGRITARIIGTAAYASLENLINRAAHNSQTGQ